jgi:RNA-directed DNA polymerase
VNADVSWPADVTEAWARVLRMQTKLHRWATIDPGRRFDDVFNLVYDPGFLVAAWNRVQGNKGGRTAGVDGIAPRSVPPGKVRGMLAELRESVKHGGFVPERVRQKSIPKAGGKVRKLGIPTMTDRVVQASLKLVLEPIFEADFQPSSYGFRPRRRAQDAIAEIHYYASRGYVQVFEADITACFDEIDHDALMQRARARVADKCVLRLIRGFLNAGVLSEDGVNRNTFTGTPQGGILSPLLANIALSVVDEHFQRKWDALGPQWSRTKHQRAGGATMKLVRYADDFVVLVRGTREDAEALWDETATVLAPMGLRLSVEKTTVTHIDTGFDFLGWHIQRRRIRGHGGKTAIYTYPSRRSLASIRDKVRTLTRRASHRTLADLLRRLNPALRGWCAYFQHGVVKRVFTVIDHFAFWRIVGWLKKRHPKLNMRTLVRRHLPRWQIRAEGIEFFRAWQVPVTRYRYRGTRIPNPWASVTA